MAMDVSIDESSDFSVGISESAIHINTSVSDELRNVSVLNTSYHKCVECCIIINHILFLVISGGISLSKSKHGRKKTKLNVCW